MITEWTGESLLQLCSFLDTRVLLTAAELDLFTALETEPATAAALGERIGAEERPLRVVLDALTAMELLEKRDDVYACPSRIGRLLTAGGEATVLPMLRHYVGIWDRAGRLTEIVRGSRGEGRGGLSEDEATKAFIEAMHGRAQVTAGRNVPAMAPGNAGNLIDVGGASGSYTVAFLRASPGLRATLFDRPQVVEMARRRLLQENLLDRVTLVPGDFYVDSLPPGHDLALVSAIIHQNSPDENVALYRNVWNALIPGGRLVIRDHVMNPDKTAPKSGALFAINMLISTPGGGTYSFEEITQTLQEAGFADVRLVRGDAEMECIVEAFRPA